MEGLHDRIAGQKHPPLREDDAHAAFCQLVLLEKLRLEVTQRNKSLLLHARASSCQPFSRCRLPSCDIVTDALWAGMTELGPSVRLQYVRVLLGLPTTFDVQQF